MSERKHKYTDLEREELEREIKPSKVFLERVFDNFGTDLMITRAILMEMAKRLEWQYDPRIDPKKPQYFHSQGELTVCTENSSLGYVIQAPLIHKRVKIWVPEDVYYTVEYMASIFLNHDQSCWMVGRMLDNHYKRKEIVNIVRVRRNKK